LKGLEKIKKMGSQGYNKKKMEERFRVTENNNRE